MNSTDAKFRFARLSMALAIGLLMYCAGSGSAAADERKVYLNGIDLADVDVRGHSFQGAEVRFDKEGNVHITVKGLQIGTSDGAKGDGSKDKKLGNKHFLVVKPVQKNGGRYAISVYINGQLAKLVKGTPQTQVVDVTRYIKKGDNTVRLVSARSLVDKKAIPSEDLELVIGRGVRKSGTVLIQRAHVEYRRRATETKKYDKTRRFTTK